MLQAVRSRDPEALGEFFEMHFDRLYSVAFQMTGRRELAEEVMQEVFLKIHRAAHQIDSERDPGPWLATLTRNACREHWRRRNRGVDRHSRSLDNGSALGESLTGAGDGPEQRAVRSERQRAVIGALMKLPGRLREVVVLRDYHGLDHDEIARIVGARGTTVRKRYSRALARLRQHLKDVPV